MKKILKYSLLAVLAFSALTGCKKALETDQFKGFSLAAIAPNPVMRGAQLRIVGNGLENVSEVQFAGNVSVTDIEVVAKGERSEIRVTVPMDGPIVGPVTVVTKDGLRASTRFDLEYSEPIEQSSFSPATALSGDVITIKGEYLQNVKCVIFGGAVKDIYGNQCAGANNTYMSGNDAPRGLYRPWAATGSFDTGDKWITVTLPLEDFTYGWNGNPASGTLNAESFASLWLFICKGGMEEAGTECTPIIKIDNIRAVPYK